MNARTRWLLGALAAALVVALGVWLSRSIEWVDVTLPVPPRGEAARDRLYAAKQLAHRLGAEVVTVRNLEELPPNGATLVLASRRWNMFPGRDAALARWVRDGGHLVALQSAWSADGDAPPWVRIRSRRPPHRDGAASQAAAAVPPSLEAQLDEFVRRFAPPCKVFAEPEGSVGAFGAPRAYRVCGRASRVVSAAAPTWTLAGDDGAVAARVPYGRGDITTNAIERSFDNASVVREDGALAFAAMLQLRPGDRLWFFAEETRTRLSVLLWEHGAPALLLAAAALALALWRHGARFGPPIAARPPARRSVGEQVRRTAAFIARDGGLALHAASVRALEDEARRAIANYGGLLARSERSDAIAKKSGIDPATLAQAMAPPPRPDRRSIATSIALLEHARRALAPGRRPSLLHRLPPADTNPP